MIAVETVLSTVSETRGSAAHRFFIAAKLTDYSIRSTGGAARLRAKSRGGRELGSAAQKWYPKNDLPGARP